MDRALRSQELVKDFRLSWRDRAHFWLRGRFRRQKCDGCFKNFSLNRVDPVSGDYWLCRPCFERWYPEFCK